MAQKIVLKLVDDLDGTEADETVQFGLDGVKFEIDLSEANAERLRAVFGEWVPHARRTGGRVKRGTRAGRRGRRDDSQDIRDWAKGAGMKLAARGRIPSDVRGAYEKAQKEGPKTSEAGTTTKRRARKS